MLSVINFGSVTLGATTATIKVLGVSFPFQGTPIGGAIFWRPTGRTVTVSKSKVPKALAIAIDALLTKATSRVLSDNPSLAANPTELLAQAKIKSGMVVPPGTAYIVALKRLLNLGLTPDKIDGKLIVQNYIGVTDLGSSYQVTLTDKGSGGFEIPVVSDVLASVTKAIGNIASDTVDFIKSGIEATLKLLGNLMKGLCALAQSDAAKLVQSVSSGNLDISGNLKASGANAQMTAAASSAASAAAAVKSDPRVAAAQVGIQVLQSICGGKGAPSSGGGPPAVTEVPWWKRPSTYFIAGGVAAVSAGTIFLARRRR